MKSSFDVWDRSRYRARLERCQPCRARFRLSSRREPRPQIDGSVMPSPPSIQVWLKGVSEECVGTFRTPACNRSLSHGIRRNSRDEGARPATEVGCSREGTGASRDGRTASETSRSRSPFLLYDMNASLVHRCEQHGSTSVRERGKSNRFCSRPGPPRLNVASTFIWPRYTRHFFCQYFLTSSPPSRQTRRRCRLSRSACMQHVSLLARVDLVRARGERPCYVDRRRKSLFSTLQPLHRFEMTRRLLGLLACLIPLVLAQQFASSLVLSPDWKISDVSHTRYYDFVVSKTKGAPDGCPLFLSLSLLSSPSRSPTAHAPR